MSMNGSLEVKGFGVAVTAGEGASTKWQDLEVVAATILVAREERWGKWSTMTE